MKRNLALTTRASALSLVLFVCGLPMAQAATVTWTGNAGNGLWFDAGNWSGGAGVPGASDDAVFGLGASGTVSLGGATATVQSLTLTQADGLTFASGSLVTGAFGQTGGTNTLQTGLAASAINLGSAAHLRVEAGAVASADTLSAQGLPTQARLSLLGGGTLTAAALDLINVRVDVDGTNSALRFTSAQAQAFNDLYLTSGGVLGCIGPSAVFNALAGASASINLGNAGQPGRIDCGSFSFDPGVNASASVHLFHNQNGYRLERPNGSPVSLNGGMRLTTGNAVRTVIPGSHGYTGPTLIGNGAALELVGELTGSAVTVQSGASLRGSGRVHGQVSVAANAALRPGTDDNAENGTLQVGSLALVDLSLLQFDLAEPGVAGDPNDRLIVDGDATLTGGRIDIASLGAIGRYPLLQVGGVPTGSLVLQTMPAGQDLADWLIEASGGSFELRPRGVLELDPPTLALGAAEGEQAEGSVTLRNVGGSAINVVQIFPPDYPRFSRVGGSCGAAGFQIPVDGECTVQIRYAPEFPETVESFALVNSDAVAGADRIPLQGVASRLPPELTPALIDFGVVAVDEASAPLPANLSNPSSLPLAITGIALGEGLEFEVAATSCGSSLAAGGSCSIDLVFQPLAAGGADDVLTVATEAGERSANLQGVGFALEIFASGFED